MKTKIIAAASFVLLTGAARAQDKPKEIEFDLTANPAFIKCLSADGASSPKAHVKVRRGDLNDRLSIEVQGIKPNLEFDLFTVQRSSLNPDGNPDVGFPGFGLAWYQTDLNADGNGNADARIRTILLARSSVSMVTRGPTERLCCRRPTPSMSASGSTIRKMQSPAAST